MRISICIPTYNRADYLPMLLDSILAQTGHDCEVEVVISDNASSDDTPATIERYRTRFPHFVYHRAQSNQGADRNFLKVVELASGDFCWLMGSDDVLEREGVKTVEAALLAYSGTAGLYLQQRSYNYTMDAYVRNENSDQILPADTVFRGAERIFSALGEYVGYISGNVIDRNLWQQVVASERLEPYLNAWVHVYVIGRMMQRRPMWVYVAQPCVGWRSGNDSFLAEGMYRRLEIDVAGYAQVAAGLFGENSPVYRHIMLRILPHACFRIAHAKTQGAPGAFFRNARKLMFRHYRRFPSFWIRGFPVLLLPRPAAKSLRWVYYRTLRPLRLARAASRGRKA